MRGGLSYAESADPMANFTETDLANINAAIATGEMTVEINGRRVVYRSISELERARAIILADMAAASPSAATRRGTYTVRFAMARE